MWRAGFGPAVEQLGDLSKYTPKQFYKALVKASEKKPEYINVADDYLQGLYKGLEEAGRQQQLEVRPPIEEPGEKTCAGQSFTCFLDPFESFEQRAHE